MTLEVKNIAQFRKFYKEVVRDVHDANRNENFIGHSITIDGNKSYGFFELFHADKENISNFLNPFLEMAQDWQAIYEFLQNAFDSNAKIFAVFFDDQYFIAFNNGDQFTFDGIRSILNIGQSTKQVKSNIGKFGIGFKMVYRLIGESNGMNELLNLNGPILYSWNKYSDLQSLWNVNTLEDIKDVGSQFELSDDSFICKDDTSWLFKILLTNFPCSINDNILNLNYKPESSAFNLNELLKLRDYSKLLLNNSNFNEQDLSNGSIVFFKLGNNKSQSILPEHLKFGIKHSLSILEHLSKADQKKSLEKVYLNDINNCFTPANINLLPFKMLKNEDEFNLLIKGLKNDEIPDNIEYFFGYPRDIEDFSIKSNPNFYLYFPLSDEKFKLNFLIHCNIFQKLSHRTKLDEGTINKRILSSFSKYLVRYLEDSKINNYDEYLKIFSAILTSDWQTNTWVYEQLIKPLIDYLRKNIPNISGSYSSKDKIRIKDFELDVKPVDFGINIYDWFYFQTGSIINDAKNSFKLGIASVDLVNLISDSKNPNQVNVWLSKNFDKIDHVYNALNLNVIKRTSYIKPAKQIIETESNLSLNLRQLNIFKFSDNKLYSINDIISNSNLLILSQEYLSITDVIKFLGIDYCIIDANKFKNIYDYLSYFFPYFNDKTKFYDYFCTKLKINEIILSIENVKSLIEIFNISNSPIFSKIVIRKFLGGYNVTLKSDKFLQCYCSESTPILYKYLNDKYKDRVSILSEDLYQLINNKQDLLLEKNIYSLLMNIDNIRKELIDIIIEADSEEIKKEYLNKSEGLNLKKGTIYSKDSYEHKILNLVLDIKDEDFRNKISILNDSEQPISLNSITFNDKVTFSNSSDSVEYNYELSLSKLYPNKPAYSELLEEIIKSFPEFNEYNLRTIVFKVGKSKHKDDVLTELDKLIETPEQLAFLLLYNKYIKPIPDEISKYRIIKNGAEIPFLKGNYYIENSPFIEDSSLLNENYQSLREIFKFNSKNIYFESGEYKIALRPFIQYGNLEISKIKSIDTSFTKEQYLNFLQTIYEDYSNQKETPNNITLTQASKDNIIEPDKMAFYLYNFIPKQCVYPNEFALDSEKLPEHVNIWIEKSDKKEKLKFLKALGVNTEDSILVLLRKFLSDKINIAPIFDELNIFVDLDNSLLLNSLKWTELSVSNHFRVYEETEKYSVFKKIYSLIGTIENSSILKINGINASGQFSFTFPKYNNDNKNNPVEYSVISLDLKAELVAISKLQENINLFFANDESSMVFVYENLYSQEQIKALNPITAIVEKTLSIDDIIGSFEELKSPAYQSWKDSTGNQFSIYIIHLDSLLIYSISICGHIIGKLNENKIDITSNGKIFIIGNKAEIPDLLKLIIGKNNFSNDNYELFIDKWKDEPAEVEKIFNLEFEPFNDSVLNDAAKSNEIYFPDGENKSFKEKLLELLDLTKSPWKGYIYHFTHIENAAKIINSKKILSRNSADFQDSAGSSFINSTHDDVKNFARFYFRPKTPTQYYNEGLGKRTPNGDLPICPVPIFLKINIREVLDKNENKSYVSNGNLRHYPSTNIGNTYEFLKHFNFLDLYSSYAEVGQWVFLNASQQEFVVKDELDFSQIMDYQIICKDEFDKQTLLELIDIDNFDTNRIVVDNNFYLSKNPNIKYYHTNNWFKAGVYPENTTATFKIESTNNIEDNYKQIVEADNKIAMESNIPTKYKLFYVNNSTKKEWLVNIHKTEPIENNIAYSINYNNEFIDNVIKLDARFPEFFQSQIRHYKLYDHILLVLNELDKYFGSFKESDLESYDRFKLFLVLHDIGKPIAYKAGNKDDQHKISLNIFNDINEKLGLTEHNKNTFKALLSDDPLGKYFQNKLTIEQTTDLIKEIVHNNRLQLQTYFDKLTIYYQVDAGSYTKDAGGLPYLEHLFDYKDGSKVLCNDNTRLIFAKEYEEKYLALRSKLGL